MEGQGNYIPPHIPLNSSDAESDSQPVNEFYSSQQSSSQDLIQWSSGICACCDDMLSCKRLGALGDSWKLPYCKARASSCCIGAACPFFLFGKNAEFLDSETL